MVPWLVDEFTLRSSARTVSIRHGTAHDILRGIGPAAGEAIPSLIDIVRAGKKTASQATALEALAFVDPNFAVSRYALFDALLHAKATVQDTAKRLLSTTKLSGVARDDRLESDEELLSALKHDDPHLRFAAAWRMRTSRHRYKERRFTDLLVELLADHDPAVRLAAVAALEKRPDAVALDPLFQALEDRVPSIRSSAWRAIGARGETSAPRLKQCLRSDNQTLRYSCGQALRAAGAEITSAVGELAALTRDPDARLRAIGLAALIRVQTEDAFLAMIDLLDASETRPFDSEKRPTDPIALSAIYLLADLRQQALPLLVAHFDDPRPAVRRNIALTLKLIARHEDVIIPRSLMIRGLHADDPQVRTHCLHVMKSRAQLPPPETLAVLLADPDYYLRRIATEMLRSDRVPRELAEPAILRALADRAYGVQEAALQSAALRKPPVQAVLPQAILLFGHESELVSRAAVGAVATIAAPESALDALIPLATDAAAPMRRLALQHVAASQGSITRIRRVMQIAASDEDPEIRKVAQQGLARIESRLRPTSRARTAAGGASAQATRIDAPVDDRAAP